ncbi:hypothetical protein KLP28_10195 [Nocardioidaceae bacterium]|nr:hypothetical protein KLP28_10195 [Nocardioidaceae bacterium]
MIIRQPDGTSCGPTCLAVARGLTDPAYAERLAAHTGDLIAAEHPLLASYRSPTGGLQAPWPRALGTSPWALRAALQGLTGRAYATILLPSDPVAAFARVAAVAGTPEPAALYVGGRLLPRHVALVLGGDGHRLSVYEPAVGARLVLTAADVARDPRVAGWSRWWLLLSPARR